MTTPKISELRSAVRRYGFGNEDAVTEVLARKHPLTTILAAEASELARSYALERPDLLAPGALAKLTPAELWAMSRQLIRDGRAKELVAFHAEHGAAIRTAETVAKQKADGLKAKIPNLRSAAAHGELRLGHPNGLNSGLRAELHVAQGRLLELQQRAEWIRRAGREPTREMEATGAVLMARIDHLREEIPSLERQVQEARSEADQLQVRVEAAMRGEDPEDPMGALTTIAPRQSAPGRRTRITAGGSNSGHGSGGTYSSQ